MDVHNLKDKFDLKELELNSLLEITQSINNNLPEESLYKIYNFILRANLNIKKLALYVKDENWSCKVNFGTKRKYVEIPLHENLLGYREITGLEDCGGCDPFLEFDTIIPVAHKNEMLAFVLVSGFKESEVPVPNGGPHTNFLQALTNIIIVAIENKKLARHQLLQEGFRKELEIARQVQKFLFPKSLPFNEHLKVEASYLPHHQVSGDYYDYIAINEDEFLVCVADVSGKGMPAAILMSNFQAALRVMVRQTTKLKKIIYELNLQILDNANGENFITFFVAIYNRRKKLLNYVNAGHNPPVLINYDSGETVLLEKGTTILGSFHPLPFLSVGKVEDISSFLFFAYTDGIIETVNDREEEFSLERVQEILHASNQKDLKQIHKSILDSLNKHKGKMSYRDDITMLSCRVDG